MMVTKARHVVCFSFLVIQTDKLEIIDNGRTAINLGKSDYAEKFLPFPSPPLL